MTARKLLHIFPTFDVGGAQVRFAQIANALGGQFKHIVIPLDGHSAAQERLNENVPLEIINPPALKQSLGARLLTIRRFIAEQDVDLVLTYNWGSIEWALANLAPMRPHLHIEDGFGIEEAKTQFARRIWTRRLAFSFRTQILVPSKTLKTIAENSWHVPSHRLFYVPNGVDTAKFSQPPNQALLDRLQLPTDRLIVGTISALREEKNLPRLINALELALVTVPVHLLIIGEGTERQTLEKLAQSKGLEAHVTFAGHISEPHQILGALDIFAISSDTEQMPYSVLEAMATGLAVAGVDVGDIKTLVAESNKSLISEKNKTQLAASIAKLAQDGDLRRTVGRENQKRATELFDQQMMIDRHQKLWSPLRLDKNLQ